MFRDRGLAERVITALLDSGVPSDDVSLVVREVAEEDVSVRDELSDEKNEFAALAVHSAWERLGWQGGARPPYKDTIPPDIEMAFLAAGPIAIAIGGAQLGACSGGIIGSMSNFGFLHDTGRQWYGRIVDGQAWVMVRTTEAAEGTVRPLFDRYRAEVT